MNLIVTLLLLHLAASHASQPEEAPANKTKRTVAGQVHTYGESRPVLLYTDNAANSGSPLPLYSPLKPVFDPEIPKQVAAQQVLYEFQQTPTNAVSNVHVNQFYQPVNSKPDALPSNPNSAPFISSSETVATPVQHSTLIRHTPNYAQVQFQPLQTTPQHVQTHQYVPGKYLYVNGKIAYQPGQQQALNQANLQARPAPNFFYQHPQLNNQRFLTAAPMARPMRLRQFSPPLPSQFQPITKPMNVPEVNEEQNEEEAEEETPKETEAEEEENEERESEESDDEDHYFGKYHFEDDDDEDKHNYREEEEEDSERGSSRPVPKKQKKNSKPGKYNKSSNFKYSESYGSSSKFEKPDKKTKKTVKNPKMQYKSVKYTKEGRPKGDFEGRQSQNVPVVHKQKIFKEKWFVTKSTDDSTK